MDHPPFLRERLPSDLAYYSPQLRAPPVRPLPAATASTSTNGNPHTVVKSRPGSPLLSEELLELSPVSIPASLATRGILCLKISHKSRKRVTLRIDRSRFVFSWQQAQWKPLKLIGALKVHEISIHDVRQVIHGADAAIYREEHNLSNDIESRWITIRYFHRRKARAKLLHVVADTDADANAIYTALQQLQAIHDQLSQNLLLPDNGHECALAKHYQADLAVLVTSPTSTLLAPKASERLSFDRICQYADLLNINLPPQTLRPVYDKVAGDPTRGLTIAEFKQFVAVLKRRPDIHQLFTSLTSSKSLLRDEFAHFVNDIQHEHLHPDRITRIYNRFAVDGVFGEDSLNEFLLSRFLKPLAIADAGETPYYSHPLNEYYISSSHNTYLMGRQVVGDSSIEAYIRALQRGCKCVEIDIWDPPLDGDEEPVVSHGRTFTTLISLLNVLRTIRQYAFVTLPWPLILSLEVHCLVNRQVKVAELIHDILDELLVSKPIVEDLVVLPSPVDLKNKILIKVKRGTISEKLSEQPAQSLPPASPTEGSSFFSMFSTSDSVTTSSFSEDGTSDTRRSSTGSLFRRNRKTKVKIDHRLGLLGVYLLGLKFTNFSLPESKTFNHCFSLSEKSFDNMLKDDEKRYAIDKHNRKYFMRIYPSQMRVKLLNFIPIRYWAHGAQMVATNWQTYDAGQQINELLFAAANHQGYVLKPDSLRKPLLKSSKIVITRQPTLQTVKLRLMVIGAHHLVRLRETATSNPYVTLEVFGGEVRPECELLRTAIVHNNGFNPLWNQRFEVDIDTVYPQFVFIRLLVVNSDGDHLMGQTMMNLSHMKRGFRYLLLCDGLGEELLHSRLFIRLHSVLPLVQSFTKG